MNGINIRHNKLPQSVEKYYHGLIRSIGKLNSFVSKVLLGAVLLLITFQVFARMTAGRAPGGINEFSRYAVIWISYLLIYNLLISDQHLKVEILFKRFPSLVQRAFMIIYLLTLTVFGFEMVFRGWEYATTSGFRSEATTIPGDIPMFYVYLVIPIGGVLICLASTYRLFGVIGLIEIDEDTKKVGSLGEEHD